MRHATTLLILLLSIGVVAADINIIGTATATTENAFTITGGDTITVTPHHDFDRITIFANGQLIAEHDGTAAGETKTFTAAPGDYDLEVRGLKTYTYAWEDYSILKDDAPVSLAYAKYEKDEGKVKLSLDGADIIHPDLVGTTTTSFKDRYDDYTITINEEHQASCFTEITTGDDLYFSCGAGGTYAHQIAIEAELGIRQTATATITGLATPPTPPRPPEPGSTTGDPAETQTGEGGAVSRATPEEIAVANDIELRDTIRQPRAPIPITGFIILMFLAFMTILFVASHHNYESKRTGTYHPLKKKK